MTLAIDVKNLSKIYGDTEAVKEISFSVKKGSLFAFLGSNGAGKSTTIEILCTLLEKTTGNVYINGHALGTIKENQIIRQSIGVVFQESLLDPLLTVKENILHRGKLYHLSRSDLKVNYEFVHQYLKLEDIEAKKYGQLSGGQRRRADIARALIHKPSILFLDEPTTGLDPHTRKFVWETIERLRLETDLTVFLTTHYMEEAANADKIIVLKRGEIVAQGSPNELKDQYAQDQLIITLKSEANVEDLGKVVGHEIIVSGDVYKVNLTNTLQAIPILTEIEPYITSFELQKGSLDQVFIQINEEV